MEIAGVRGMLFWPVVRPSRTFSWANGSVKSWIQASWTKKGTWQENIEAIRLRPIGGVCHFKRAILMLGFSWCFSWCFVISEVFQVPFGGSLIKFLSSTLQFSGPGVWHTYLSVLWGWPVGGLVSSVFGGTPRSEWDQPWLKSPSGYN